MKRGWTIGDKYRIKENGATRIGEIIEIDPKRGYIVQWDDGEVTTEDYPDPKSQSMEFLRIPG